MSCADMGPAGPPIWQALFLWSIVFKRDKSHFFPESWEVFDDSRQVIYLHLSLHLFLLANSRCQHCFRLNSCCSESQAASNRRHTARIPRQYRFTVPEISRKPTSSGILPLRQFIPIIWVNKFFIIKFKYK